MKVSIQVNLLNGWDNNIPAVHTVATWEQAVNLAYYMSHQFGNCSVRVCKLPENLVLEGMTLPEYIGRISGCYIQSQEPNTTPTYKIIKNLQVK